MVETKCRSLLVDGGISDGRILVAVSGGRDSTVLLEALNRVAPDLGLEIVVGHVNHQLRAKASDSDHRFVETLATQRGLACQSRSVDPDGLRTGQSSRDRLTLEEAARELRRDALLDMARESNSSWIATAHHAGDQAETVLLRILRGTGPDGLAAMAPISADGRWLRPLLDVEPDELEVYAHKRDLEWIQDESNQDRRFARNRLRLDEIPRLVEQFNPQLLRTLCNLAEAQRRDFVWIESLVEDAARGRIEIGRERIELTLDGWQDLPEALARRLVRRALLAAGLKRDITRVHIERALAFLRQGKDVGRDKILELPCGITLRRRTHAFELGPIPSGQARQGNPTPENATLPQRE